jgi:hypothetical protein
MQHLDEGTIHAWLDGALTADEAARAEAHVKDCAQCQASVAEARGFIAASSRILTALDNAPRGVIPAAAPARRVQAWVWRVAATVLVVATGTILLVREQSAKSGSEASRLAIPMTQEAKTDNAAADSVSLPTAELSQQTAPTAALAPAATAAAAPPPTFSPVPRAAASRRNAAGDQSLRVADGGLRPDEAREKAAATLRKEPSAPVAAPAPAARTGAFGAVSGAVTERPRQVATTRTIGKTETFYEIAPGDTVVLEEQSSAQLQSVVVTGAATNRAAPMLRAGKAAAAAAEPQQKTESSPAPPPPPAVASLQDASNAEIHRISWLDRSSGRVLILSGRHSQEELEQIREKIQQLRDAAAQPKKPPQ